MEKIFCIGFPKTGTTSLEVALKILGYNVCKGHYSNNHSNYLISLFFHKDYDELDKMINYFDAFCDLPWGGTDFYLYLSKKYPDAKFIHTTRDSEKWYASLEHMFTEFDDNLETALDIMHQNTRYGAVYYLKKEFQIDTLYNNKEKIIQQYSNHNRSIEQYFNEDKSKYLKMSITKGDTWVELCKFLGKDVPGIDFPNVNKAVIKHAKNDEVNTESSSIKMKLYKLKRKVYRFVKKIK